MKLEGKEVCVTGGAGFLGSCLCRQLVARGAEVTALDNFGLGRGRRENLADLTSVQIVKADVSDLESLGPWPAAGRPLRESQVVFHLAAVESRQMCQKDFPLAFDVNVRGTMNVLSLCSEAERVVFSSTMTAYGEPEKPVDEGHPLDGCEPYSVTKIAGEFLCRAYRFLGGLPFTIVRISSIYGPRQAEDRMVPSLILEGLARKQIEVWTPDVLRDYLYVDDCARGLIELAESEPAVGETVNLGTGRGTASGELADIICRHLGATRVDLNRPPPVSSRLVPDITKLRALTGWEPKVGLEEGLRRTIEYYRASHQ